MAFNVTATIVLYRNNRQVLLNTIHSFLNTELNVKLYLIDNSPTDELRDIIIDSRVEYFHNPANPGFGAGHNLAIKKIIDLSKYHIILNPDIYFDKGNLEKMVEFMDNNSNVGQMMPKVLYPNGSLQYLCKTNPTPFDLFARRFLPGFVRSLFKDRLEKYEYRDRNYDETMFDVPYLSGCFMFLRTSILKQVGFFDDRIFMYIEDADLTRRFLKVSNTAYFPQAIVYHHFEKGSHKDWKLTWYSIQGAIIYFNKWGWIFSKK